MRKVLCITGVAIIILCCQPHDRTYNSFSDAVMVTIADFKDRRLSDSLYRFFSDENEQYRAEAAKAFGWVQDTSAIGRLGRLLVHDASADVRKAAAFALDQTHHRAAAHLLCEAFPAEKIPAVRAEILKAYGKTAVSGRLHPTSFPDDSTTSTGLAWSLYNAGLRGNVDSAANLIAAGLLGAGSQETRLAAAHFFARASVGALSAQRALIRGLYIQLLINYSISHER